MSTNQEDTEARQVQKTASVAPSTVTALSTGAVDMQPKKTRRARQRRSSGRLDYHINPKDLPQMLQDAIAEVQAQGIYTRVEIRSMEEVVIR